MFWDGDVFEGNFLRGMNLRLYGNRQWEYKVEYGIKPNTITDNNCFKENSLGHSISNIYR